MIAIGLAGCANNALVNKPTPEQEQALNEKNNRLVSLRDNGKITWSQWAAESNQIYRATYKNNISPRIQVALQYKEAVASQIDKGQVSKETGLYFIAEKLVQAISEDEKDRRATRPVICSSIGDTMICK